MTATSPQILVGLIGPGLVGKEFLAQLPHLTSSSSAGHGSYPSIRAVGIINSTKMLIDTNGIPTDPNSGWASLPSATTADLNAFAKQLASFSNETTEIVLVDASSSETIAEQYVNWVQLGCHIVTPNKKGFSGKLASFETLMKKAREHGRFVLHESTVGAGLPILSTLNDLVETGDEIVKIEGIFSGTLSYIFNGFSQLGSVSDVKFSDIVKTAKELGYTEPDPRDDLNGMDVARKVVILGRLAGLPLTLESLSVENIVPEPLQKVTTAAEFMSRLPEYDTLFTQKSQDAFSNGKVLRYVGQIDLSSKTGSVTLQQYSASHPFASLKGSDNIIAFTTKRFPSPLVIQGAGAGASVTAFGMLSDLLKIAKSFIKK